MSHRQPWNPSRGMFDPRRASKAALLLGTAFLLSSPCAWAFDSGSTGVDGDFAPTVDTRLQLPENGVFNFQNVDIPAGVTVTFEKNTTNTPVVILASGDVNIAGTIDVSGSDAADAGTAGDGHIGDDGLPGIGGPGGYDGGIGGLPESDHYGGDGLGPGGGKHGMERGGTRQNGGGGSFGTSAAVAYSTWSGAQGTVYGSALLLPLIGGSGGGGGMGGNAFSGSGGGGGGGAILIAATGTVDLSGSVLANGGKGGDTGGGDCGAVGGAGSGGGIRVVATTITGDGAVEARGGGFAGGSSCITDGYNVNFQTYYVPLGGDGRIRLEADTNLLTSGTTPAYSFGLPGDLFIAGLPTLRISRVAGVDAPARPTGVADISLPADTINPVSVEFEATGIPLGNAVELTVTPQRGDSLSVFSDALDGDTGLSTASAQVNMPQGPSTLMASITYTLIAALAERFERFAGGEKVKAMRVEAGLDGEPRYVLITESGREISVSRAMLASAG